MVERGIAQYNAGQYRQSVDTLMSALSGNANDPQIHYHLGNALCQVGDYVRALREYDLGYRLSRTGPIAYYCRQAIAGCRQKLDNIHSLNIIEHNNRRLPAVAMINPSIGSNTTRLHGNVHCPVGTYSHPGGVDQWPNGPPMAEYVKWLKTFNLCMQQVVHDRIRRIPHWETITGKCELYVTIDSHNRLRARVERSDTDEAVNQILLDAIKYLDGSNAIAYHFPMDGFHFYYGFIYPVPQLYGDFNSNRTTATLTNTRTSASVSQLAVGLGLTEYKFRAPAESSQLTGALGSGSVFGKLLTPKALKANQLRLIDFAPLGEITQKEVNGTVISRSAGGEVVEPQSRGEFLYRGLDLHVEPQASGKASLLAPLMEEAASDPAAKSVSGRLTNSGAGQEPVKADKATETGADSQSADKTGPGQSAN
ncbi:MAG TPA: hypothetical protein V6C72_16235 [Chroococcales cyanobacterium]